MDAFFKTFTICLILALGFLFYKFFGVDGYSKDLNKVNNNLFTIQKEKEEVKPLTPPKEETVQKEQVKENKAEVQKSFNTCYFYNQQGKLTPIVREVKGERSIENAVLILLKGPLISETKKGIYTEIPPNVSLINIQKTDKSVIVNLSDNFANGGGSSSTINRVKQLSATVKAMTNKQVYLYIDGKEVEYLGGDGVYIKQPLD